MAERADVVRRDEAATDAAPEEEIDLEARVPSDEPGADLGEAFARHGDEEPGDDAGDDGGPRVTDAYRSGS